MEELTVIPIDYIRAAQKVLADQGLVRTPLVPLNLNIPKKKIYLKLENFQPVKSFKVRGACNAIAQLPKDTLLQDGVYTASTGNFAQGLAWSARNMGIPCCSIVPDSAPLIKLNGIKRFGADIVKVPYDEWWKVMTSKSYSNPLIKGTFIQPVYNRAYIAGNGTIGIEIFEDLPKVDTVVCPWGGGGHCSGIASALKALKPEVKVIACEVETGAPLSTSLKAGKPSEVTNHRPSFVDGMNGKSLFPEMWGFAKNLVADSVVLTTEQIARAVKLLVEMNSIVAEGAGAAPVAAALTDSVPEGTIVCVISGGNIDMSVLSDILMDNVPN